MAVYDPYFSSVALLLQFDGTNGSTSFIDSSLKSNAVSSINCQLSSTQKMFGGTSAYFNRG